MKIGNVEGRRIFPPLPDPGASRFQFLERVARGSIIPTSGNTGRYIRGGSLELHDKTDDIVGVEFHVPYTETYIHLVSAGEIGRPLVQAVIHSSSAVFTESLTVDVVGDIVEYEARERGLLVPLPKTGTTAPAFIALDTIAEGATKWLSTPEPTPQVK